MLIFLIFWIANTTIDSKDIKWRFILHGNPLGYLHEDLVISVVVFENIQDTATTYPKQPGDSFAFPMHRAWPCKQFIHTYVPSRRDYSMSEVDFRFVEIIRFQNILVHFLLLTRLITRKGSLWTILLFSLIIVSAATVICAWENFSELIKTLALC